MSLSRAKLSQMRMTSKVSRVLSLRLFGSFRNSEYPSLQSTLVVRDAHAEKLFEIRCELCYLS